ncbi:MAG: hypothetical protein AB1649_25545 [Chloroflexota bacterium]
MKNSDKILIAIVAGVVLLVAVAFIVALTRPDPAYQAENTPEGVAHNYLLALQQEDYERAYGYLSPDIRHYPRNLDRFITDIQNYGYNFSQDQDSVTLEIVSSRLDGNRATIEVKQTTFYQGDLFNSGEWSHTFTMNLKRNSAGGAWKIYASDSYWVYCWTDAYSTCK